MALNPDIVEDVANSNFKVIANAAATGVAQSLAIQAQNAAAHQQHCNMITEGFLAEALGQRAGIDTSEAVATKKVAEADLGRSLAELGEVVAALQQYIKTAQTTPPPTA